MDRFAGYRRLQDAAVDKIVAADREWWRPWRSLRLRREARNLLARAAAELDRAYDRSR